MLARSIGRPWVRRRAGSQAHAKRAWNEATARKAVGLAGGGATGDGGKGDGDGGSSGDDSAGRNAMATESADGSATACGAIPGCAGWSMEANSACISAVGSSAPQPA